jgi:hypothetical protein
MCLRAPHWILAVGVFSLVVGLLPSPAMGDEQAVEFDAGVVHRFVGFDRLNVDEPSVAAITTTVTEASALHAQAALRLVVTLTGEDGPVADTVVGVRTDGGDAFTEVTTDAAGRLVSPPASEDPWTIDGTELGAGGERTELQLTLGTGDYTVEAQLVYTGARRLFGAGRIDKPVHAGADQPQPAGGRERGDRRPHPQDGMILFSAGSVPNAGALSK